MQVNNVSAASLSGGKMQMEATVHRLRRPYISGDPLANGEFVEPILCAEQRAGHPCAKFPHCEHEKALGVYTLERLGVVVGGNALQKVESYLKIKLANLKQWLRS